MADLISNIKIPDSKIAREAAKLCVNMRRKCCSTIRFASLCLVR